jgi:hypothetical protein
MPVLCREWYAGNINGICNTTGGFFLQVVSILETAYASPTHRNITKVHEEMTKREPTLF